MHFPGYYAGLLSTVFMLGRLFSSHFWGLVTDRHGCRFVMAFGLCATAALSVAFGFSPTFAWAVSLRWDTPAWIADAWYGRDTTYVSETAHLRGTITHQTTDY